MSLRIKRPAKEGFTIDISALVDVLFTLLIFFSLTSTFVQESGISVELPRASSGDPITEERKITITIDQNGTIFWESKKFTTVNELKSELSKVDPEGRKRYLVIIKADFATTHGAVTQVLDVLKSLRFTNIAIATRSE